MGCIPFKRKMGCTYSLMNFATNSFPPIRALIKYKPCANDSVPIELENSFGYRVKTSFP